MVHVDGRAGAIRRAAEAAADEQERRSGVRVLAVGRLAAIPAVALTAVLSTAELPTAFWVVFGVAALFEAITAAVSYSARWERLSLPAVVVLDLIALGLLVSLSGGAQSDVRDLLVLFPLALAFALRPWATATVSVAAGLAFGLATIGGLESPADREAAERFLVLLAWAGAVATTISAARQDIARRTQRLLRSRGELLTAVLDGESRRRRAASSHLHEDALQHLLAARMDLREVADSDAARALVALDAGIGALREAVADLHPVALDHGGLGPALRTLAEREARQGELAAEVHVDPDAVGVQDDVFVDVAREVLANIRLHAHAATMRVDVRVVPGGVALLVEDDGVGFDLVALPDERRVGLAACRERVEALGGVFTVRSARGRGTHVLAVLPAPVPAAVLAGRPPAAA